MFKNKGTSPVVAIALLLVLSVVSVISFQNWYQTYSSDLLTKAETDSGETSNTNIEALIGDQLYFKNTLDENISIKQIKLGNRDCNVSTNVSPGVNNIPLGTCVDDLTLDSNIGDITIITDKNIYTKKHLFKEIVPLPPITYSLLNVNYNSNPTGNLYEQTQVLINISSNETIQSCSLNFNGSINSAFTINGTNCWITQSVPTYGTYNYNVTVISANNGKNTTTTQSFTNLISVNWFGDGSDGDILVNSSGVYQDLGSGYSLHPDTTGTQWNSVQDGDIVVINAQNFAVESGVTFTTTNRCRGLMIYATGNAVVNGTISMTARGAHANPADSTITANTPVAPSDGNSVPEEGLVIRRVKSNWSDVVGSIISNANALSLQDFNGTHNSSDLFYGTGNEAVLSEANQNNVTDGLVISIPRAGGSGGGSRSAGNIGGLPGIAGSTLKFGSGGGGGGGPYGNSQGTGVSGTGTAGTCFSGGSGGGSGAGAAVNANAQSYGGQGGCGVGNSFWPANTFGAGTGNNGGVRCSNGFNNPVFGNSGTGGLLLIFVGNDLTVNGDITSEGVDGSYHSSAWALGGASGGGIIGVFYSNHLLNSGTIGAIGGSGRVPANLGGAQYGTGGNGGAGSVIGPIKIDK